ncbi:MAG TPA: RNA methyltransferase [Candidatus Babeliaceae bacterium]|nr:RNA methyltransferase [Candidatus Babeliaceae bacterium]
MKRITSLDNPFIKQTVSLHTAGGRLHAKKFIGQGYRVCSTLIEAGLIPEVLYVTPEAGSYFASAEFSVIEVTPQVMEKISTVVTPSGVLGVFSMPAELDPTTIGSGLVLAQIHDPGNMGTLIRTAVALNLSSIVIVEGCDPFSPKVVQASAGTIGFANIFTIRWQELLAYKKGLQLQALVIEGGSSPCEVNLSSSLLVVGNEARGIPQEWLAACESKISLPMPGRTESLNAAIAGSIALYVGFLNSLGFKPEENQ